MTLTFDVPTTIDPEIDFFTYQVSSVQSTTVAGNATTAAYAMVKLSVSAFYQVQTTVCVAGFEAVATVTDADGTR